MELLYLWIEDFRQIHHQGFTFGSKFKFDLSGKGLNRNLVITYNQGHFDLYPKAISSLTALVGKNGSGKSSILNCLKLVYGQMGRITSSMAFVYLDPLTKQIHTSYYQKGGVDTMPALSISIQKGENFPDTYTLNAAMPYQIIRHAGDKGMVINFPFDLDDAVCAYLTNGFNNHRESPYTGILNESTTQKVDDYLELYVKAKERAAKQKPANKEPLQLWPTHLEDFYRRELRSNVRFVQYVNDKLPNLLPYLPKEMVISFNWDDYDYLLENDLPAMLQIRNKDLKQIHRRALSDIEDCQSKSEAFQNMLQYAT